MDDSRSCSKIALALSVASPALYFILKPRFSYNDISLVILCMVLQVASVVLAVVSGATKEKRKDLAFWSLVPTALSFVIYIKALVAIISI